MRWTLAFALALGVGCGKASRSAPVRDGGRAQDAPARVDAAAVREVVILRQVSVDVVAPAGETGPAKDAIVARLSRLGTGVVPDAASVPAGWAGRFGTIRAVVTYDRGGTPRSPSILMTIEASLELDGDALGAAARAAGEGRVGPKGAPHAADDLAATLIDQVATELTSKLTLRAGTSADLVAAATGTDSEAAAWALELAGERQDPALRDAAIAALGQTLRSRTAAIQYLVALGDPATVNALTATVDFADQGQLAAIIEAVTAIGGQDAREFLELLASGATDSDIMARATDGLRRLDRREDAGP
jgi:hypothetical protein